MQVDYLMVGQGLAGSILARLLIGRGRKVLVIDREDPSAASRVAAGLVNPVTGQKLVVTWRADHLLPFAREFYRDWEIELGEKVFFEKTIWRFFQSDKEAERWEKKRNDPGFARFAALLPDGMEVPELCPQQGGFQARNAFYVNTRNLLRLFRRQLKRRESLVEEDFSQTDLQVEEKKVTWRRVVARKLIFCEGHKASQNSYFNWIPFRHAKGELLTLRGPLDLPRGIVLNRGKWLLPLGDGRFRAGATYGWNDLSTQPTEAGREEILRGIRSLVATSAFDVERHEAGVRPIVKDTRPVAGVHPAHPSIAIFNGLGSKGVLWGPYFGDQLIRHLEIGGPLDAAVDIRRNL